VRARNLKPDFFLNEKLAEVSAHERLLFIGLWCLADREGRLEDRPKRIRAAVFPYEDVDVDSMLDRLHQAGFLIRYQVDQDQYIALPNFLKHQSPHSREMASVIPPPWQPNRVNAPAQPGQCPTTQTMPEHDLGRQDVPSCPPDSPFLIPDSLIADSPLLIEDSPLLIASAAEPPVEDPRMDSFHPTKQTANHETQTMNPKAQTKNYGSQTNHPKSSNPCASPPNEDSIEEEPGDPSYPPEFEQFWQQYPRQTEKKRAFRVWQARIKDKVDARDLIRAAEHYAAHCDRHRTEAEFIKHPSTFLGPFEVYRDWIESSRNGGGNGDGRRPDGEEDFNRYSF
jgi:hypothetical protein